MPFAAEDYEITNLHPPGPNCTFAGFIGPRPECRHLIKPVDYVALAQMVSVEEKTGEETVEETRAFPAIMTPGGELRLLQLNGLADDEGFQFLCCAGSEAACEEAVSALAAAIKSIEAHKVAGAAPAPAPEPPNNPDEVSSDAT